MRLKIRCDGKSEKFCKIFWELNKALVKWQTKALISFSKLIKAPRPAGRMGWL